MFDLRLHILVFCAAVLTTLRFAYGREALDSSNPTSATWTHHVARQPKSHPGKTFHTVKTHWPSKYVGSGPLKILVISDTHGWPQRDWSRARSLPPADILIHCGDLTENTTPAEYASIMNVISRHKSKIKIVIAGNHDGALDGQWLEKAVREKYHPSIKRGINDHNPQGAIRAANKIVRRKDIIFLSHGLHKLHIHPERHIKIFASPLTPAPADKPNFGSYAFTYDPAKTDPFSNIRDKDIDLFIVHGPPKVGINDRTPDGDHIGDNHLWRAVQAATPALVVHGHNHPVPGDVTAVRHFWPSRQGGSKTVSLGRARNVKVSSRGDRAHYGIETLIMNAAILSSRSKPDNPATMIQWDPPHDTVRKTAQRRSRRLNQIHYKTNSLRRHRIVA